MPTNPVLMANRWSLVAFAAVLLGLGLIAASYRVQSQTFDEGVHVAAGVEWYERGQYTMDPHHTPLTRIAVALGPYLDGVRLTPGIENVKLRMWQEGDSIFFHGKTYLRTLTLARFGILPFYVLLAFVVWSWARILVGPSGASVATAFVALAPPVIAHASLATTDVGAAATCVLAIFALIRWLDAPSPRRAAAFGGASALALCAKLSAVPYIGLCMVLFATWRLVHMAAASSLPLGSPLSTWRTWWSPAIRQIVVALAACAFVIWAIYRFSIIELRGFPVPAGELLRGFKEAFTHSSTGHYSYLLGERSTSGWWYYFPVTVAVKTPLFLLALGTVGLVVTLRRWRGDWRVLTPVLLVIAVFLTGVATRINIGVRHVLPLYAALGILAAVAVIAIGGATRGRPVGRSLLAAALLWFTFDVIRASPNHLAYFNELSRADPGAILVDSNLDWGQDMFRLSEELKRRGISEVSVSMLARPVFHRLTSARVTWLWPGQQATGWVAVSETCLRHVYPDACGPLDWLPREHFITRVGSSIRLFHVPPPAGGAAREVAGAP